MVTDYDHISTKNTTFTPNLPNWQKTLYHSLMSGKFIYFRYVLHNTTQHAGAMAASYIWANISIIGYIPCTQ